MGTSFKIMTNDKVLFGALDVILDRWTATPKLFPYDSKDAVVPQRLIPESLRKDTYKLFCFYFYVCLYMRGRITSEQAFKSLLKMQEEVPEMFKPLLAQDLSLEFVMEKLQKYVNRDIQKTAEIWIENSKRLVDNWKGDPRNILKGVRSYKEALRRMRNKRTKKELSKARRGRCNGAGFMGYQHKMVSMFLYFIDWEGLLEKRFLYPAPADFHNFRFGFVTQGLVVIPYQEWIRFSEKLSKPWRYAVMRYLRARPQYDVIDVADALWLFSALMCGKSPVTTLNEPKDPAYKRSLFQRVSQGETVDIALPLIRANHEDRTGEGFKKRLLVTCLPCPFLKQCKFAIPSTPYYQNNMGSNDERRGGRIYFLPRPKIERRFAIPDGTADDREKLTPSLFADTLEE